MTKPLPLTVSAALTRILKLLDRLNDADRARVLAAIAALGAGES